MTNEKELEVCTGEEENSANDTELVRPQERLPENREYVRYRRKRRSTTRVEKDMVDRG